MLKCIIQDVHYKVVIIFQHLLQTEEHFSVKCLPFSINREHKGTQRASVLTQEQHTEVMCP